MSKACNNGYITSQLCTNYIYMLPLCFLKCTRANTCATIHLNYKWLVHNDFLLLIPCPSNHPKSFITWTYPTSIWFASWNLILYIGLFYIHRLLTGQKTNGHFRTTARPTITMWMLKVYCLAVKLLWFISSYALLQKCILFQISVTDENLCSN